MDIIRRKGKILHTALIIGFDSTYWVHMLASTCCYCITCFASFASSSPTSIVIDYRHFLLSPPCGKICFIDACSYLKHIGKFFLPLFHIIGWKLFRAVINMHLVKSDQLCSVLICQNDYSLLVIE